MKISQKIIDYAIRYYLNFFPSKKKIADKLKEKFWPDSEKWKRYWWISDEEISFIIEEKMKNILQEDEVLKSKINSYIRKWKSLNYIKQKLFEKKFDKNDIDKNLEKIFWEEKKPELENLEKEFDKISKKIIKWEKISNQKVIEKLLQKWFFYWDIKKILL